MRTCASIYSKRQIILSFTIKIDIIKCFIKVSTIANLSGVASLSGINIFKLIEREFPHNNAINIFNLKPPSLLMVYCIEKDAKY